MSNLVATLKAEISRVARKEVRAEIDSLKKSSASYRSGIADLRRQVALLEKELRRVSKGVPPAVDRAEAGGAATEKTKRRFSAARLAAHREKLGISAASYGELIGVSGQTIYHWEQGRARPHAAQLEILAGVRSISKAQI